MDATIRFSGRADDYARTRPGYPRAVLEVLLEHGLVPGGVVADLGSGTGIFSSLLLEASARVYAVEPNDDMRALAERALSSHADFRSVAARAEATSLPDASVDLVTAAQAFHWFDPSLTRRETCRILRPRGHVALVWNDRETEATPFLREYDALLVRRCPGYRQLQGKSDTPKLFDGLFGEGRWERRRVPNEQRLDRDGLHSRVMSSSYAPKAGEPGHDVLVRELDELFARRAVAGEVVIPYQTVVIGGLPLRASTK